MSEAAEEFGGVGAVVIGGDYQGLGVVRSLGRYGIPIFVLDDEPSIARFSRYTTKSLRVPTLRERKDIVDTLLAVGREFRLDGWVLFPTRDEIVAAIAQDRQVLSEIFRVPTPDWDTVRPAWDKRLTYELAGKLGIPAPKTRLAHDVDSLRTIDLTPPLAVKPAIKEHFIYETRLKAVGAETPEALESVFRQVSTIIPPEEAMIQELIPGGGEHQFSYCAFFKDGKAIGKMVVSRARQRPTFFGRSSTYVLTVDMPILEEPSRAFSRGHRLLRSCRDGVQVRRPRWALQAPRRQFEDVGLPLSGNVRWSRLRISLVSRSAWSSGRGVQSAGRCPVASAGDRCSNVDRRVASGEPTLAPLPAEPVQLRYGGCLLSYRSEARTCRSDAASSPGSNEKCSQLERAEVSSRAQVLIVGAGPSRTGHCGIPEG